MTSLLKLIRFIRFFSWKHFYNLKQQLYSHMNKSELVSEIQANLGGASKADAENALSAVLASVKTAIKKAGKTVKVSDKGAKPAVAIQLVGFGTFFVTRRNARSGINPITKAPLKIKASKAIKFKPGAGLKDAL